MTQTTFQKSKQLSICSANCLRRLSPMAQCNSCEELCPAQALSFTDGQWHAANCSLCGLCTMICPTQVFQIDGIRLAQYKKNQPLQLCCAQNHGAPADALRLNCLQQLHPLMLCYLLYQHPQITIYLVPEQCQQCTHHWYAQGLPQQMQPYQIPKEKLQFLIQQPEAQSRTVETPRRSLFRQLFHQTETQTKKLVADHLEPWTAAFSSVETASGQAEVFPVRLPLYALYLKKQLPLHGETELPFHQLECISCSFCTACTSVCPTKALTIQETQTEKELLFQPELCVNCNLCQSVCMQHGLQWGDFMTQQQFLHTPHLLAHSKEKICTACEHGFYQWPDTQETICRFCRP